VRARVERCRTTWAAAWGLAVALAATVTPGQEVPATVETVSPVAPAHGSVIPPRTVFEIGYDAMGEPHPRRLRFRIRLVPTDERGRPYVFDQARAPGGWLVGDSGRVLYRPRKPLQDGVYRWEAAAWNGIDWVASATRPEIRIDGVPPADVEALRLSWDREAPHTLLEWNPVALDQEGRPEFVSRYHVYRHEGGGPFRRVRLFEVGVVLEPRFVDVTLPPPGKAIRFYHVTAEDEAGNEGGTR